MALKISPAELLRAIPSVQELLQSPRWQEYSIHPRLLKTIIQEEVENFRQRIVLRRPARSLRPGDVEGILLDQIQQKLEALTTPRLQPVVNATGIILHTNLGRAPLSAAAQEAILTIAGRYCNLEIELYSGKRGERNQHIESLLHLLTGAEAGLIVNNNAAAVLLVLNTLCRRKEVPVSRGELVEIGGAFRMPDVMKMSGARMVEVGTTNKTHLRDYREAISERTGAILKVHPSNYRILGFTAQATVSELVDLAHQHEIPLVYDMGSGAIEDLGQWEAPHEPVPREMIKMGVDILTFSGDKLPGGPQAGVIVGKKAYIQRIKKNPLTRALRCDKLTYAALEATLRLYVNPAQLPKTLPVVEMLTRSVAELDSMGKEIIRQVGSSAAFKMELTEAESQMGSGTLPLESIPSRALTVRSASRSPHKLAEMLRKHSPPIIGYVKDDLLWLNLRSVLPDESAHIVSALREIAGKKIGKN